MLLSWVARRLVRMQLFAHKRFFRMLNQLLRQSIKNAHGPYLLAGVYTYLVGKISVTGNAMSRSMTMRAGQTGSSRLRLRAVRGHSLVRTSTGCLGFTLFFFFKPSCRLMVQSALTFSLHPHGAQVRWVGLRAGSAFACVLPSF